ncbi:hypothetical protein BS47DRAFT_1373784 [Hydnum rufescens UP504]|uniref:Scamp-domain-containing protein n=1 Tax=Hydnum rufescens UP504 TaxID=1448309 RepID=A0A9P6AM66_9AGAM|nr:hypothetical protein BS47DRAFT_1373784 [Hydnum rufescens UP504]
MSKSDLQNPFSSTASLDQNPFEDPHPNPYADLERRERELQAREAALNSRQALLERRPKSNWPFFYPLIFHSIELEIPEPSRPLMSRLYQLWLVLLATLVINIIACIFILIAGSSDGGKDLGASISYLPLIGILSFLLWYRPIYNGYMKEQALYYYLYFFFCGWHLLFSVYMIIGIPSTGSAGLIQTVSMFSRGHIAAAILGVFATAGWTVQGLGNLFYYREIWSHHNAEGHSFTKAKGELAEHGARSYFSRQT